MAGKTVEQRLLEMIGLKEMAIARLLCQNEDLKRQVDEAQAALVAKESA